MNELVTETRIFMQDILGTPSPQLLDQIRQKSQNTTNTFKFEPKAGSGIARLLPHCGKDCIELIEGLLVYDPETRFSARQAVRHPYFKELRDAEKLQRREGRHEGLQEIAPIPGGADGASAAKTKPSQASSPPEVRKPGPSQIELPRDIQKEQRRKERRRKEKFTAMPSIGFKKNRKYEAEKIRRRSLSSDPVGLTGGSSLPPIQLTSDDRRKNQFKSGAKKDMKTYRLPGLPKRK